MSKTPKSISFPSLDFLREGSIKQVLKELFTVLEENHHYYQEDLALRVVSGINGDTTPDVQGVKVLKTANTGATSITTFDNAFAGQQITIIFGDANTTIATTDNIILNAALTGAANGVVSLVYDGTNWFEKARST